MKPAIPTLLAAAVLSMLIGCHHRGDTGAYGRVLAQGGELGGVDRDTQTVIITDTTASVLGVIEVPDGSRMQVSYAAADALARAELLKLVRVRIQDEMVSVDSTDPARVDAREHTVESVAGSLRHAGTIQHGWERIQRGERIILRVYARLSVPRAELDAALARDRAR